MSGKTRRGPCKCNWCRARLISVFTQLGVPYMADETGWPVANNPADLASKQSRRAASELADRIEQLEHLIVRLWESNPAVRLSPDEMRIVADCRKASVEAQKARLAAAFRGEQ